MKLTQSQALSRRKSLVPNPSHLINTHWHFDRADGNAWLQSIGAKIIAQENTRKYLSKMQRVEDWDYNFVPPPPGGIPSEVFAAERSLRLNGSSLHLKRYAPAHTDSDISVTFAEADIVHVGDTFWNGIYPFLDYSTGGSIDGMIAASDANLAVIPRHARCGPGQRYETQEAGTITRRDCRGEADLGLRCEVRQLRYRRGLLHQAGL